MRRLRRRLIGAAVGAAAAVLVGVGIVAGIGALDRAFPPVTDSPDRPSVMVLARDGRLLRAFTTASGRWRLPVAVEDVDPRFLEMLVAYEDQRFFRHAGVDPRAVVRAAWQAARHGRIVSGASTLTMQTARLLSDRRERTVVRKLAEMARSVQLEWRLGKREILERYLNLAPYGGNLEGIRAASLAYFGREPRRLTVAQAALLVALPQSPETRRPDRHPEAARAARDRVLARLAAAGVLTGEEAATARGEPVPTARGDVPRLAPHVARRLVAEHPGQGVHRLTIDRDLQESLERLARERAGRLGPNLSVAILVVDHGTGEILASVGAADFLSERRQGHVDMTRAVRSPGSALKPFVYGLAFEAGIARPATLVEDVPSRFGGYEPENFDDEFRGTVSVREALQLSLNVPAVAVLEEVGPIRLAVRLQRAGAELELPTVEAPGLAIGLGGLGLRLIDLAHLYAALARGGEAVPLVYEAGAAPAPRRVLLAPEAAGLVTGILKGTPPPRNAPRGQVAYKTGTSYGHRDAWAIGYDGRHVVAVWVGRPDGAPVPELTGWLDAAPLLFDSFARIAPERVPLAATPAAASAADLPPPLRRLHTRAETSEGDGRAELKIAYPPDGAEIALRDPDGTVQPLAVRVISARSDLTWLVDGRPVPAPRFRRRVFLPIDRRGPVRITVIDAAGAASSVTVSLI